MAAGVRCNHPPLRRSQWHVHAPERSRLNTAHVAPASTPACARPATRKQVVAQLKAIIDKRLKALRDGDDDDDEMDEIDDGEEEQGEHQQPRNRRSWRDEGPREGEGEEPDEETARRHEKCLLELDAAVADGEGLKEEIHRPPIYDAAGPAVQQMDDDRDRDPEGAEEEDGI